MKSADVINLIDCLTSDDFCDELLCELALSPENLTVKERNAAELISKIYRIAHSNNRRCECYKVHGPWREYSKQLSQERAR